MKTRNIIGIMTLLTSNMLYADFIDIEREVFEPVREMQRMDEAMNRAIEKRRQENQALIDEQQQADIDAPMPEFVLYDKQYVLTKEINDAAHTTVDVTLEQGMVNISAVTTTIKKIVTDVGTQDSSFKSTTQESLSVPHDANPSSLKSEYKDGQLRVTLDKK